MTGNAKNQIQVLRILSKNQNGMILDDLDAALPEILRREIVKSTGKLVEQGLVERIAKGNFRITDTGQQVVQSGKPLKSGPRGRHCRKVRRIKRMTLRQKAWNVMRMGDAFSVPDLVQVCAISESEAASNLHKYVKQLLAAGYLLRLPRRSQGNSPTSNGHIRYRLISEKNTGPEAPIFKPKTKVMIDPNSREELSCKV